VKARVTCGRVVQLAARGPHPAREASWSGPRSKVRVL